MEFNHEDVVITFTTKNHRDSCTINANSKIEVNHEDFKKHLSNYEDVVAEFVAFAEAVNYTSHGVGLGYFCTRSKTYNIKSDKVPVCNCEVSSELVVCEPASSEFIDIPAK